MLRTITTHPDPERDAQSDDDLLTVLEAGTEVRASRSTVFRLIRSGELASIKVGRERLVRRGALREFVRRREGQK